MKHKRLLLFLFGLSLVANSAFAQNNFGGFGKALKDISSAVNGRDSSDINLQVSVSSQYANLCERIQSKKVFIEYSETMVGLRKLGVTEKIESRLFDGDGSLYKKYRESIRAGKLNNVDVNQVGVALHECNKSLRGTQFEPIFVSSDEKGPEFAWTAWLRRETDIFNYPSTYEDAAGFVHLYALTNPELEETLDSAGAVYVSKLKALLVKSSAESQEKSKEELKKSLVSIYSQWQFEIDTLPAHKEKCSFLKRWGSPGYSQRFVDHVTKVLPAAQKKVSVCYQQKFGRELSKSDYNNWLTTDKTGVFYGIIINNLKTSGVKLEAPRTNKDVNQCVDAESESMQGYFMQNKILGFDTNPQWCNSVK